MHPLVFTKQSIGIAGIQESIILKNVLFVVRLNIGFDVYKLLTRSHAPRPSPLSGPHTSGFKIHLTDKCVASLKKSDDLRPLRYTE